eukprot:737471-Pleurochrysis_carterae.AAC.1
MSVVRVHIVVWVITWIDLRRVGGGVVTDGASLTAEVGAHSLAQRARPAPSVENATSAPPSLNRALSAVSFNSVGAGSADATRAAFAGCDRSSRAGLPLTRRGQSLCQC